MAPFSRSYRKLSSAIVVVGRWGGEANGGREGKAVVWPEDNIRSAMHLHTRSIDRYQAPSVSNFVSNFPYDLLMKFPIKYWFCFIFQDFELLEKNISPATTAARNTPPIRRGMVPSSSAGLVSFTLLPLVVEVATGEGAAAVACNIEAKATM